MISPATREARHHAADLGGVAACYEAGKMYENGNGTPNAVYLANVKFVCLGPMAGSERIKNSPAKSK
jgi:TPR repeat protein